MMSYTSKGDMLCIDECCEILNDQLKKMSCSDNNLQSLMNKSLFVSLKRRYKKCTLGDKSSIGKKQSDSHVTPTRKSELEAITKLFESVRPLAPMNRKPIIDCGIRTSSQK